MTPIPKGPRRMRRGSRKEEQGAGCEIPSLVLATVSCDCGAADDRSLCVEAASARAEAGGYEGAGIV